MKQHISSVNFVSGYGKIIREAMFEGIHAVTQSLERKMVIEFQSIIRDVQGCVLSKGEQSESQRFPGTAQAVEQRLGELRELVDQACRTIGTLRG
jgi:hypothetical protein